MRQFLLTNVMEGSPIRFRVNLAALRGQLEDHILGFPFLPEEAKYDGPTLFVVGARGKYVTQDMEPQLQRLFPNHTTERLDAGHWVHAEKPYAFMDAVGSFLKNVDNV